jgi:hypothetical protein
MPRFSDVHLGKTVDPVVVALGKRTSPVPPGAPPTAVQPTPECLSGRGGVWRASPRRGRCRRHDTASSRKGTASKDCDHCRNTNQDDRGGDAACHRHVVVRASDACNLIWASVQECSLSCCGIYAGDAGRCSASLPLHVHFYVPRLGLTSSRVRDRRLAWVVQRPGASCADPRRRSGAETRPLCAPPPPDGPSSRTARRHPGTSTRPRRKVARTGTASRSAPVGGA